MTIDIANKAAPSLSQSPSPPQVQRTAPSVAQAATGGSSALDTVTVTDTAQQLRRLEKTLTNQPVVDLQRVESIRKQISRGSFATNPARVADKLVRFEHALRA